MKQQKQLQQKLFKEKELYQISRSYSTFLSTTIALLRAVSIFSSMKYKVKQKHLLPYHVANNKLKKRFVWIIYYENAE